MLLSILVVLLLAVIGLFKLRSTGTSTTRMPGFPIAPLIFLAAGVFMLVMSFIERPLESSIAIITILIGIPFYFHFFHKKTEKINGNYQLKR